MKLLLFAVVIGFATAWDADCNNIDPAARKWVESKKANNDVYLIGLTYCKWCTYAKSYIKKMGFDKVYVENLDVSVSGRPDKIAVINYAYCQYSKMKSVPQVFIRNKFIGGSTDTRHHYYTGAGAVDAKAAGKFPYYFQFKQAVKQAAIDFVDEGVKRSAGGKYFVLSKVYCPHCKTAKQCLKSVNVPEKNIELYEINDFETHDEIKLYKQRLTGSPYTPLLAYNGKVLRNHHELIQAAGCRA